MKRSYSEQIIFNEDDSLIGFNLGFDLRAEHSFGIRSLLKAFGVSDENGVGIEGIKATKVPKEVLLY